MIRFTAAESALHQAKCNICKQNPILGFRYLSSSSSALSSLISVIFRYLHHMTTINISMWYIKQTKHSLINPKWKIFVSKGYIYFCPFSHFCVVQIPLPQVLQLWHVPRVFFCGQRRTLQEPQDDPPHARILYNGKSSIYTYTSKYIRIQIRVQ